MRRSVAVVLAAVIAAAALTGCGRLGHGADPVPAPAASTPAAQSADTGDVLADLDAADDAIDQATSDGDAAEDAARTDDAP